MKSLHSLAIESQFHWKSCMMTSVEKGVRMGRARGEVGQTFAGDLPGSRCGQCEGDERKKSEELGHYYRETRERNSRREMWESERMEGERGSLEPSRFIPRVLRPGVYRPMSHIFFRSECITPIRLRT